MLISLANLREPPARPAAKMYDPGRREVGESVGPWNLEVGEHAMAADVFESTVGS